jgi:DnaJ-like protein
MPSIEPLPAFDLYHELGLARDADGAAVEDAWRRAIRRHHPDVASDPAAATARAARLNVARDWLRWPAASVVPRSVAVPTIDPLGAWPERRRRRAPSLGPVVVVAVMMILTSVTLGVEQGGILAEGLFLLGALILGTFALIALFTLMAAARDRG